MAHPILENVDALTFDCYGTLIDWETGLRTALRRALGPNAARVPDEALLSLFAARESAHERPRAQHFQCYRQVLRLVLADLAARFSARPASPDALAESILAWPAFPDTPAALASLKQRFRLCIASNIDDDLFELSRPKLGVALDELITAQQVRSYKPRKAHLREAMRRLDLPPERIVHVAQSLYHDIAPAKALGLRTIWVNRQAGRPGATPTAHAAPDLEVPDMATLASLAA